MNSLVLELLECPLFSGIQSLPIAIDQRTLRAVSVSAGQNVFDQDDDSCDVFFPVKGELLALQLDSEGRELIFSRINPGGYFGELSAIDLRPRSLSVYAKTDARLLVLKRTVFSELISSLPLIRDRVLNDLVARIRILTERAYQLTTHNVQERVMSYLVRLALEAGEFKPNGSLKQVPTHAEIAGTIGANREAVSRCMSNLKRDGIVDAGRQRVVILQPDALLAAESA